MNAASGEYVIPPQIQLGLLVMAWRNAAQELRSGTLPTPDGLSAGIAQVARDQQANALTLCAEQLENVLAGIKWDDAKHT